MENSLLPFRRFLRRNADQGNTAKEDIDVVGQWLYHKGPDSEGADSVRDVEGQWCYHEGSESTQYVAGDWLYDDSEDTNNDIRGKWRSSGGSVSGSSDGEAEGGSVSDDILGVWQCSGTEGSNNLHDRDNIRLEQKISASDDVDYQKH
jgi:hypothetical protein